MKFKTLILILAFSLISSAIFSQESSDPPEPQKEKTPVVPAYHNYKNSLDNLYLFSYTDEISEVLSHNNRSRQQGTYIVNASQNNCRRIRYDNMHCVSIIEDWIIKDSLKESYMASKKIFTQQGSDLEIAHYVLLKESPSLTVTLKDSASKVKRRKEYSLCGLPADFDTVRDEWQKYIRLDYIYDYQYDELGRVTCETVYHYNYEYKYSSVFSSKSVRTNIYIYKNENCPPECEYYENGVLRMTVNYKTPEDYLRTVFFDNDSKVTAEYKNGKKVLEIFYNNENETFRKTYE